MKLFQKDRLTFGKTGKLVSVLIIATTITWGIVFYKVIEFLNQSEKNESEIGKNDKLFEQQNINRKTITKSDNIKFFELDRDPFTFAIRKGELKAVQNPIPPRQHLPPPIIKEPKINYSINGIIINDEKKLVIFEDLTNNKTLFLRIGEDYKGIVIKEITKNKIMLDYAGTAEEFVMK